MASACFSAVGFTITRTLLTKFLELLLFQTYAKHDLSVVFHCVLSSMAIEPINALLLSWLGQRVNWEEKWKTK